MWMRLNSEFSNQLFGLRKIKTRINTHSTSHCHDVRGYVQKTIFLVLFNNKPIFQIRAGYIADTKQFVE